ncbi:MAG: VCBS repeat-containing protein [Myxococcales bacterium]|nr:VCBS repeat-containing protein [Myxococcales bacterium]
MFVLAALACSPGDVPQVLDSNVDAVGLPEGVTSEWFCGGDARAYDRAEPAFTETTADWGLTDLTASTMIALDLDADRYPDLVVNEQSGEGRDDPASGVFGHRVLMNREVAGRRVFVDETVQSGLIVGADGASGSGHGVYVGADVDGDGDIDLFAGRSHDKGNDDTTGERNAIFLNDGAGHFSRLAASGLETDNAMPTASAAFTEVDGDGIADLWMVNWYEEYGVTQNSLPPKLYRGVGDGHFADVSEGTAMDLKATRSNEAWTQRGNRRPGFGATACDLDGDSSPELLQSTYARSWNLLFTRQDGEWVERGEEAGFDEDQNLDYSDNLYYVCWCAVTGGCDPQPAYACPDTRYAAWTPGYDDHPARLGGNTFTTVCGDVDNDGDADLFNAEIHHEWAGVSADESQLLLNDGTGRFEHADSAEIGLDRKGGGDHTDLGDLHAAFLDYDNDGWKDLLVGESDYPDTQFWAWHNEGDGTWEEASDETGLNQPWPHGIAVADFDLDGDVDVVTGSSHARGGSPWTVNALHLYENGLGGSSVRLSGLALGSRVEVQSAGTTQTFEVGGGYGVGGMQHDQALTIGLAGQCAVDSIAITPPFGETTHTDRLSGQ